MNLSVQNRKRIRIAIGSLLLILLVLGVGGALAYVKSQAILAQMSAPPPPEMPEAVLLDVASSTKLRQSTTSIGTILAPQSVQLRTELTGSIAEIKIKSGELVKEGDLLLQLDASVEEAQLKGAQAALRIARSTLKRTKQAASVNALSQLELEQAEGMEAQASADVERLTAMIRKKTMRAPFDARIGLCDLHVGQYLPEGTPVTMLQGVSSFVHVDFSMPQNAADEIHVGDPVVIVSEQGRWEATVIAVDSQADKLTRGVMARAKLSPPPPTLQPNDSVRVELRYGLEVDAVAIPPSALRRSPDGSFVYIAQTDEEGKLRAKRSLVQVGSTTGSQVLLLGGVEPGQTIVADGSFKLRDKSLIRDMKEAEQAQAAPDKAGEKAASL